MKYTDSNEWKLYIELTNKRPDLFIQSEDLLIITDPDTVNEYVADSGQRLGVVYKSQWNTMLVDLVKNKNGDLFSYDRLIGTSTGVPVVTIPVYDGKFVLIKQYRHAIRSIQYAFPRGFGEDGLSAEENAVKELLEEVGATFADDARIKVIGSVTADSGITSGKVFVVYCEIISYEEKIGYEGIQKTILLSERELGDWIKEGESTMDSPLLLIHCFHFLRIYDNMKCHEAVFW
ncbi:MAG: NUDIX hydrolase [Coprococcus comes]